MQRWLAAAGCQCALLEDGWVAYGGLSGETHLLNDESVAVLRELDAVTPLTIPEVCTRLQDDFDMAASDLEAILRPSWNSLVEAGLVREAADTACL